MKKLNGVGFLYLILGIIIAASAMMVGGLSPIKDNSQQTTGQQVAGLPVNPSPNGSHSNLQLKTFPFATLTPEPTTSQPCAVDNEKKGNCECIITSDPAEREGVVCENKQSDGTCPDSGVILGSYARFSSDCSTWGSNLQQSWGCDNQSCIYVKDWSPAYDKYAGNNNPNCPDGHAICWGKPVIYLYPLVDTAVTVTLDIPGSITKSDPLYNNGWFNVLAHPNGTLVYQGKQYSELFYESQITLQPKIQTGVFIEKTNLQNQLISITTKLGLLPNEQQEFLDYWLPKLNVLPSKYIFVSILTPQEKDKVDHVTITPKPSTNLAYLFYFKPANKMENIPLLTLPQTPPKRVGFTAVEWGGTIAN